MKVQRWRTKTNNHGLCDMKQKHSRQFASIRGLKPPQNYFVKIFEIMFVV